MLSLLGLLKFSKMLYKYNIILIRTLSQVSLVALGLRSIVDIRIKKSEILVDFFDYIKYKFNIKLKRHPYRVGCFIPCVVYTYSTYKFL